MAARVGPLYTGGLPAGPLVREKCVRYKVTRMRGLVFGLKSGTGTGQTSGKERADSPLSPEGAKKKSCLKITDFCVLPITYIQ